MSGKIQTVYITLDNGREGAFSGPALVEESELPVKVSAVRFIRPRPLPPGVHFEAMNTLEEEGRKS